MQYVNYELAGAWRDHVAAFAMKESSGNPDVALSDGRQARGLLGLHPAEFRQYYGKVEQFAASTKDTWEEADIKTCASYLEIEVPRMQEKYGMSVGQDLAIQGWQEGIGAVEAGARNFDYLTEWTEFFQAIRSGKLVMLAPKKWV